MTIYRFGNKRKHKPAAQTRFRLALALRACAQNVYAEVVMVD
jgi:hypothetical protein